MSSRAAPQSDSMFSLNWFIDCPLFTKSLIFICSAFGFLNIFFSTSTYFVNKPFATISGWQSNAELVHRLIFSPFAFLKLLELVFGFLAYLPMCARKEKELGTVKTIVDFFWKNFLINMIFIAFIYLLSVISSWFELQACYGLWPIFFAYLVERCLEDPEGISQILCLPIQIKTKYYPIGLFLLFSMISGTFLIDILVSMLVGFLHFRYLNPRYSAFLNDGRIAAWEGNFLFSWTKNMHNYISPAAATGSSSGQNTNLRAGDNNNRAPNNQAPPAFTGKGVALGGTDDGAPKNKYVQIEDETEDLEGAPNQKNERQ